ncbi:hypothetical protein NQ318_004694 [Aromia moschata]|uniref:Ig-like domain-containing protein n=1 Tax=Aromia moschata TaxID=1265417 RepID=A0AAV8XHM7_9CUCU|nr:hypothetical protein NQ318_004694 [Aromia moschata]
MCRTANATALLLLLTSLCNCCPFPCICKWKNGKQTAECVDKDLVLIPDGLDAETQVLEFSGNNLRILHQERFLNSGLINLQRIYVSRCRISVVEEATFKGLTNLVELDLSDNLLEVVPSAAFLDCPALMRLTLSRNPIRHLERAAFNHLSFLTTLELSGCEISEVDEGAFQGVYSLEWLHLDGNRMTSFSAVRHLPAGLKGVQLQENPWQCDCHILDLHGWLLSFAFPHSVEPLCRGPRKLSGKVIKYVPAGELACLPDITPTTFFVEIEQGRNVSLACQVRAVPEANITWYFEGQLLQNDSFLAPGVHLLYYIERGAGEKHSELFIYNVNTEDNGTFVCYAENPAGASLANFTIKVIVKQELNVESNEIPLEFVLMVATAAAVSTLLLLFVAVLSLIKCRRNARFRRKRDTSKVALRNSTKDNLLQDSTDDSEHLKENSNLKLSNEEEGIMLYSSHPSDELLRSLSTLAITNQLHSPVSSKCYQEQNPDLINGTEAARDILVENRQLGAKNQGQYKLKTIKELQESDCNLCVLPSDVRLSPVGLLSAGDERSPVFTGSCYRTLPYNRANKRQSAAVPIGSAHAAPYEHYGCDVRYTADGYPARASAEPEDRRTVPIAPSPPDSHRSASSTSTAEPCCSTSRVQWPSCVPAATKKCVGAQTQTECFSLPAPGDKSKAVAESTDEGYAGE